MLEQYLEQLHSADASERRAALEYLQEFSCEEPVIEAASYLLTDADRGVREAASRLLVLCSNEKAASLTAAHISSGNIAVRNLAGDVLVRMKSAAVNTLLTYIGSADKDVRKFAIDILAQLPANPAATTKIAERLNDIDPNVVCAAVDAIGALQAEEYIGVLLDLYDKFEYVKQHVIYAVAKIPQKVSLAFLERALSDENPVVQLAAAEALAGRKDKNLLNVLLQKLDSISDLAKPVLLYSIVRLLESTDYPDVLPSELKKHLLKMLDDTDPVYVRAAIRGLKHFVDDRVLLTLIEHVGKAESIDGAIFNTLKDHFETAVSLILKSSTIKSKTSPLIKMLLSLIQTHAEKNPAFVESQTIEEVVSFISTKFPELDADTKITVISTCRYIGSKYSTKMVEAALEDPDSSVKIFALDLAAEIGPQFFIRQLQQLSKDYDEDIRIMASTMLNGLNSGYRD